MKLYKKIEFVPDESPTWQMEVKECIAYDLDLFIVPSGGVFQCHPPIENFFFSM